MFAPRLANYSDRKGWSLLLNELTPAIEKVNDDFETVCLSVCKFQIEILEFASRFYFLLNIWEVLFKRI